MVQIMKSCSPTQSPSHSRNQSLVGFDPFSPILCEKTMVEPKGSLKVDPLMSIPSTPVQDTRQMRDDLLKIALELKNSSPQSSSHQRIGSPMKHSRRSSTTDLPHSSPVTPVNPFGQAIPYLAGTNAAPSLRSSTTAAMNPRSSFSSEGGLTDGTNRRRHRKAQSLAANTRLWKEVQKSLPILDESTSSGVEPADLVEDLWKTLDTQNALGMSHHSLTTSSDNQDELFIPNLSKPRPTSLLGVEQEVAIRTCESDPSTFQLGIPEKDDILIATRTAHFMDTYRSKEALLDLSTLMGKSKVELAAFAAGNEWSCKELADFHRPVVESLVDSCPDMIEVKGHFGEEEKEVIILERQKNQFLVVFRGSEIKGKQSTVLLKDHGNVSIIDGYLRAVQDLAQSLFNRLGQLTEESPFSDIVFGGHGAGAAMATIAAYLFARSHQSHRVAAYVTISPRVGAENFRHAAHSQPNLHITRIEIASSEHQRGANSLGLRHVGHCIRLQHGSNKVLYSAKAYKFAVEVEKKAMRGLFKKKRILARDVMDTLESLKTWPKDFHDEVGEGVRGQNNEKRNMS